MDLQLHLGLSLPTFDSSSNYNDEDDLFSSSFSISPTKKRSFIEEDGDVLIPTTLPFLPLTPSHELADLDDDLHTTNSSIVTTTKCDGDDGGECGAVGWPPLMSQRKKLRFDSEEDDMASGIRHYVKVRMEGEGIGRKVDLSLHHSFHKLKQTLISMFGKCNDHSEFYELAYQDREGDWLLAEDLPWKNFLQCAQRLKLVKRAS